MLSWPHQWGYSHSHQFIGLLNDIYCNSEIKRESQQEHFQYYRKCIAKCVTNQEEVLANTSGASQPPGWHGITQPHQQLRPRRVGSKQRGSDSWQGKKVQRQRKIFLLNQGQMGVSKKPWQMTKIKTFAFLPADRDFWLMEEMRWTFGHKYISNYNED